ncbi:5171_t:CDS:2, partial [Cetraspora pellucida]
MTCVQERIGNELLEEEEQAMLNQAIALSLMKNGDIEDSLHQSQPIPTQALTLFLRKNDNTNDAEDLYENFESIPRSMSFATTLSQGSTLSGSDLYTDIDNERTRQRVYTRRRYPHSFNDLLEDICSYLYFLIKATCLSIVLVILSLIVITVVQFTTAFLYAVNAELESIATEVELQILKCKQEYAINQCDPESRVPFLEENCTFWAKCSKQDPYNVVTRAEVIAGLIARLISAFV